MINAVSSRSNLSTKSSLEDKALWPYYKVMKVFLPKVSIVKKSQKLCLFEKLTSETKG